MSDRIVVMDSGKAMQIGRGEEIYEDPRSKFVADFIGETNLLKCRAISVQENISLDFEGIVITVRPFSNEKNDLPEEVFLSIRPEKILISREALGKKNSFIGKVKEKAYIGTNINFYIELANGKVVFVKSPNQSPMSEIDQGEKVYTGWDVSDGRVLLE